MAKGLILFFFIFGIVEYLENLETFTKITFLNRQVSYYPFIAPHPGYKMITGMFVTNFRWIVSSEPYLDKINDNNDIIMFTSLIANTTSFDPNRRMNERAIKSS